MKVKDLMDYLSALEPSKKIDLMVNLGNPEDESKDVVCNNLELWNDGTESITLFVSRGE
jgi:hypothetical protein